MKTNAIIRIIIWSLLILILVSILFSGMYSRSSVSFRESKNTTAQSVFSVDPKDVREINIEWVAGNITIQHADIDTIEVSESAVSDPKYTMIWSLSNGKLNIQACENVAVRFGFQLENDLSKDLMILVPMDWKCDTLDVEAASATLDVKNMIVREVDFDNASGTCNFTTCVVDQLDLDTASGDIYFTGSLNTLDCDAASASVYAVFENVPSRIDMDSMSGDLDITLPADAGFTVSLDGLSTDFFSEFDYSQTRGGYSFGDGSCKITMDAVSGDIYIREAK